MRWSSAGRLHESQCPFHLPPGGHHEHTPAAHRRTDLPCPGLQRRAGPGRLSRPARSHRRAIPGRRLHRHRGAHPGRGPDQAPGPARGGGQPQRRGRHHRHRACGQERARRPHPAADRARAHHGQPGALQEAALRPAHRAAHGLGRGLALHGDGRQPGRAGQGLQGPGRGRAPVAGQVRHGFLGAGTQPHQVQVFMDKAYGLQSLHVAYKGEGPCPST